MECFCQDQRDHAVVHLPESADGQERKAHQDGAFGVELHKGASIIHGGYGQNQYPKYTIERLISANELTGDMSRKTFFIDEPESHEDLVILSFAKERVVVNMGILQKDEIKI